MKKIIACVFVAALTLSSSVGFCKDVPAKEPASKTEAAVVDEKNNPIEKAFAKDFESAVATPEIAYVAEAYSDAWKAELKAVSDKIKKAYKAKEDVKRVDTYLADYETLIKTAFDLEMLNWISEPDAPIAERSFGTGATGAAMLAQGKMYKQATMNLVDHYNAMNPDAAYVFSYKGKGADLDALRKQNEK